MNVLFNDLGEMPDKLVAAAFLMQWCVAVDAAKIPAFIKFANKVRDGSGFVHFVESRMTNGILEGITSKIQLAKRRPGTTATLI